ncbi:hypothetical protein Tco_0875760 [Tanacetum coccineum]|uniref:Uncharacterized protein n=1 Tax=Tanacetum coccineum TaxID=301880 RepID=A0ABQ5BVD3_9ASTR
MHALLIQHGCEAALEVLPTDMEVEAKAKVNKKYHIAIILCLGNKVPREVTGETIIAEVWSNLEALIYSCISDGAKGYGALATVAAYGTRSIWN